MSERFSLPPLPDDDRPDIWGDGRGDLGFTIGETPAPGRRFGLKKGSRSQAPQATLDMSGYDPLWDEVPQTQGNSQTGFSDRTLGWDTQPSRTSSLLDLPDLPDAPKNHYPEYVFSDAEVSESLLGKIRKHPKVAAAVVAASLLVPTGIFAGSKIKGGIDSKNKMERVVKGVGVSPEETEKEAEKPLWGDLNENGLEDPGERISAAELAMIPDAKELPPVLDQPIKTQGWEGYVQYGKELPKDKNGVEVSNLVDEYMPQFVAAYKSELGLGFNVYVATQPGEEAELEKEYTINPVAIELILQQIEANAHNAPDSATKTTILQTLQNLRSGTATRTINMVVDVSKSAGCIDAADQLVAYAKELCDAGGFMSSVSTNSTGNSAGSIVIGAGSDTNPNIPKGSTIINPTEEEVAQAEKEWDEWEASGESETVRSPGWQMEITAHETLHGLDLRPLEPGERDVLNTYERPDTKHAFSGWMIGEAGLGSEETGTSYDFSGEYAPSPELGKTLQKLVRSGHLEAIVTAS